VKSIKFLIITHASSSVGLGHFNRCVILAKEILKNGHKVEFFLEGDLSLKNKINNKRWVHFKKKINYNHLPKSDVCIVDKYIYDEKFYFNLRKFIKTILIFDDNKYKVPKYVSAVINPNIYVENHKYEPGIKIFSGKKYLLIKKDFFKNTINYKKKSNIFLCMGGSDPENQTTRLISIILSCTKRKIEVLYGPGFKQKNVIRKWEKNPRIITHRSNENISRILKNCRYAIVGSGTMLYELIATKIPLSYMSLGKNQNNLAKFFSKMKSMNYLGYFKKVSNAIIEKKLILFETKLNTKQKKTILITRKGPKKLVKDILNWYLIKNSQIYSPYTSEEIINEYNVSSKLKKDHQRIHWGSKKSMMNRYRFINNFIKGRSIKNWLDIGSGIGGLQKYVLKRNSKINSVGLEISDKLFKILKRRNVRAKFYNTDFQNFKKKHFDLITCLGVMSKTNLSLNIFFSKAKKVLDKGGFIIADFTNYDWKNFKRKNFYPEVRHLWFKRKNIIHCLKKIKRIKVIKLSDYDPSLNKIVQRNHSHTLMLIAKKI
tara:strand:- start:12 stop:1640 length:1629 start_codon:yes stop_codon:yes gene_type:complete